MSQAELADFKYYRMRMRYLKWVLYLSKDGKSFDYEIGPFDYAGINSYIASELPASIKDADKGL